MESEYSSPSTSLVDCFECGCIYSTINRSFSGTYLRSVKRKYDEFEEENRFTIPGFITPQIARVDIENEGKALRETVGSQQQTIQDLISELEEERNASSSAANEAMSMILRLQGEKAELQMEARQFKRFAEEKMVHDQQEMLALEDLLYKREQMIQSLTCEVQAYKHRMMSYGIMEAEADGADEDKSMSRNTSMTENIEGQYEFPPYQIYPPLKCNINEHQVYPDGDDETVDFDKYAFGETPHSQGRLKDLEHRINELEKSPRTIQPDREYLGTKNMHEKVIVGQSPRRPRHPRMLSTDSSNSQFTMGKEMGAEFATDFPNFGSSFRKTGFSYLDMNSNLTKVDNESEVGDDMNDRVYTIDSIHQGPSIDGVMDHKTPVGIGCDDYVAGHTDALNYSEVRDLEFQKLYARLQALEADRESMRQAMISVGTDKAQLVLLKEIAQKLCKEMSPSTRMPVHKHSVSVVRSFSFISLFKWIISLVFWRRKACRCKYMFGLPAKNEGLLMLLDRGPRVGQWRHLSTTNM